jgi:hypothetical protein
MWSAAALTAQAGAPPVKIMGLEVSIPAFLNASIISLTSLTQWFDITSVYARCFDFGIEPLLKEVSGLTSINYTPIEVPSTIALISSGVAK